MLEDGHLASGLPALLHLAEVWVMGIYCLFFFLKKLKFKCFKGRMEKFPLREKGQRTVFCYKVSHCGGRGIRQIR